LSNIDRDILLTTDKEVTPGGYRWKRKEEQDWHRVDLKAVDASKNEFQIIIVQNLVKSTRFCISLRVLKYVNIGEPQTLFRVNTSNIRHKDKWRNKVIHGPHYHFYDADAVTNGFSDDEPAEPIDESVNSLQDGVNFFCRRVSVENFWELIEDGAV